MRIHAKFFRGVFGAAVVLSLGAPVAAHAEGSDDVESTSFAEDTLHAMDDGLEEPEVIDNLRPNRPKVPRFQANSAIRISAEKKLSSAISLEIFSRAGYGSLEAPYAPANSSGAGGLSLTSKFGGFVSSTSIEKSIGYSGIFRAYVLNGTVFSQGLARNFKLIDTWAITPGLNVAYASSSNSRQTLTQTVLTAPLAWTVGSVQWQPFIPRVTYQTYANIDRRDWTVFAGVGFKWNVTSASSLSTSLGFQERYSNIPRAELTRWVLAPQLAYKMSF
jgi:hypothetical protein